MLGRFDMGQADLRESWMLARQIRLTAGQPRAPRPPREQDVAIRHIPRRPAHRRNGAVYAGGEHANASAATADALEVQLGLEQIRVLAGVLLDETRTSVAWQRFRLVRADVDVFGYGRSCLDWVWHRLVPGRIVVIDDYGFHACGGITRLVSDMPGMAGRMVIYNTRRNAIVLKRHS